MLFSNKDFFQKKIPYQCKRSRKEQNLRTKTQVSLPPYPRRLALVSIKTGFLAFAFLHHAITVAGPRRIHTDLPYILMILDFSIFFIIA